MRKPFTGIALAAAFVITPCLMICPGLGAQTAPAGGPQQFVVLQSEALTVPFDSLTAEQAHCSISGSGNFATMRCQAAPPTAKAAYHYVAVLVVDEQGMAFVVACHQSLVDLWCKKKAAGVAIQGAFDGAQKSLAIADGQKSHAYQTLTTAFVGPVQATRQAASSPRANAAPAPANAGKAKTPQPTVAPANTPSNVPGGASNAGAPASEPAPSAAAGAPSNGSAACVPAASSCTAFVSEPAGADIYVDGKFVGSTPSTLALAPGSHEIRIQADKFKPWTRTLESTAGNSVTIHAALAKK